MSKLDLGNLFGQSTRPYYLGQSLDREGWEVANVGINCAGIDFGESWSTSRASVSTFAKQTRRAHRQFRPDVVYAHQNLPATAALVATLASGTPVVADFHSIPSLEWKAVRTARSGRAAVSAELRYIKARASEELLVRRCPMIVAAGQSLSREISEVRPARGDNIVAVPNGVSPHFLAASAGSSDPFQGVDGHNVIAVIPRYSSVANEEAIEFLGQVGQQLSGMESGIKVHVVGTNALDSKGPLIFHGVVPDLRPWLENADACLLPYTSEYPLAGGARNKLLEYLAVGRRVVSTQEGLRGLEEAGEWAGVELAPDDPAGFAAAVAGALRHQSESGLGSEQLRANLTWDRRGRELSRVLRQLVEDHGG